LVDVITSGILVCDCFLVQKVKGQGHTAQNCLQRQCTLLTFTRRWYNRMLLTLGASYILVDTATDRRGLHI